MVVEVAINYRNVCAFCMHICVRVVMMVQAMARYQRLKCGQETKTNVGIDLVTSTTLLGNNVGEGLHLVLGTTEGTDTALDELAGTLVLGVTDELHGATLVRSEAGNLTDDGADDLDALALTTLTVGRAGSENTALGLVTAVDAPDET